MNAIVGAPDQRADDSGSSKKRERFDESALDGGSNTFLPASRKLPEWLKACVREDGSYDKDLAKQWMIATYNWREHKISNTGNILDPMTS